MLVSILKLWICIYCACVPIVDDAKCIKLNLPLQEPLEPLRSFNKVRDITDVKVIFADYNCSSCYCDAPLKGDHIYYLSLL